MAENNTRDKPWQFKLDELEGRELSEEIFNHVEQCIEKRTKLESDWNIAEKLLGVNTSLQASTLYATPASRVAKAIIWGEDGKLRYNIVKPVKETLKAHIAGMRPKPRYLSAGGSFTQRQKSRNLTKYVKGVFVDCDAWSTGQQVFDDSTSYKVGYAKPVDLFGKIVIERVHPRCVVIDEQPYGLPELWYHVDTVSRWKLLDLYPEFEDAILDAQDDIKIQHQDTQGQELSDQVTVVEAWYCPASKKGRHIITISNEILVNDEWESDKPGLVPFVYDIPLVGFYGSSIVDKLKQIQIRINYILLKIQKQMDMGCFKLVASTVDASVEQINNVDWQIIKVDPGSTVQVVKLDAVDPVYFQELDRLEAKAYQIIGVSEQFGQSNNPKTLTSGRAIEQWEDIQTKRFLYLGQRWQSWYVALGEAVIDLARSLNYKTKMGLDTIKWSDIDLDKDDYVVEPYPVALIPDTPAGIIQTVIDMAQQDPSMAADMTALIDSADVAAYLDRELAPQLLCQKVVDDILFGDTFTPPDKDMDLDYLAKQALKALQQARLYEKKEAEKLLRQLLVKIADLQMPMVPQNGMGMPPQQPNTPPPGQPGMPPQAPQGAPQPGPQAPKPGTPPPMIQQMAA